MKMFPGGISIIFVSFNYYIVISEENAFGSERLQGKGQDRLGCDLAYDLHCGVLEMVELVVLTNGRFVCVLKG